MMGDPFRKRCAAVLNKVNEDLQTDSVPVNSDVSECLAMRDTLGIIQEKSESNEKDKLQNLDSSMTSSPEVSLSQSPNNPDVVNVSGNSLNQSRNSNILNKQQQKQQNGIQSQGLKTTCNEAEQCSSTGQGGSCPAKEDDDLVKVVTNLSLHKKEAEQESPRHQPPSTTNKPTLAVQSFHQTATVGTSSMHTPTQEISSPSITQSHHKSMCEEEEHYDLLLLYSEDDTSHCEKFKEMAKRQNWKVATVDDFAPNLPKFTAFNSAFLNSTYTVLLITDNFFSDIWCESHYQTALVQSIENPLKRYCVIPVTCQKKCSVPMELSVLTSVSSTAPNYEKIMIRTIDVKKRLEREKAAGLTPTTPVSGALDEKQAFDVVNSSLDEIYRHMRPELKPGDSVSRVICIDDDFRQICDIMDRENPLNRDWRLLAEKLGFNEVIQSLQREKSPTAKVLECYCFKQLSLNITVKKILESLHINFKEIVREDVAQIIEHVMKK